MRRKIKQLLAGIMIVAMQPLQGAAIPEQYNNTPVYAKTSKSDNENKAKEKQCSEGVLRSIARRNDEIEPMISACGKRKIEAEESAYTMRFKPSEDELYYYKNVLSDGEEKEIYQKIVSAIQSQIDSIDKSNQKTKIQCEYSKNLYIEKGSNSNEVNKVLTKVLDAVRSDHPEWYYIGNEVEWSASGEITQIGVYVVPQFSSKTVRDNVEKKLIEVLEELDQEINNSDSLYTKVKKIHNFIIKKTYYVKNVANAHNITGVLVDGEGVCESYAKAAQLFFNYYDIQNCYVTGTPQSGNIGHAWNQVYISTSDDKTKFWVDLDATWDDMSDTPENKANLAHYDEVSYRYFCRNEKQFKHLSTSGYGGDYKADYAIQTCATDEYSYFQYENQYYLNDLSDISSLMQRLQNDIQGNTIKSEDGKYIVRIGSDVSIENNNFYQSLKKDHLVCNGYLGGKAGDLFYLFSDDRTYQISVKDSVNGAIYSSISDYKQNNKMQSSYIYTKSITGNEIYIKPKDGYSVSAIRYKKNGSDVVNEITLDSALSEVEGNENLYKCSLENEIEPSCKLSIEVEFTQEKTINMAFEETSITKTYGESVPLTVKIHGDGTHPLNANVKLYYYTANGTEKVINDAAGITNGEVRVVLNGDSGTADLDAGTYKIYAKYLGDENYSARTASTNVEIEKADLTYTAQSFQSEYGKEISASDYQGNYDATGFKYNDSASDIDLAPELYSNATKSSTVGDYPIQVRTSGRDNNYNINVVLDQAKVTIKKVTPRIQLTTNKTNTVLGDTITITAKIENPHSSEMTANLPTYSNTNLYLDGTLLGKFERTDTAGVYTYQYKVPNTSPTKLQFSAKTDEVANYLVGENSAPDVKVDTGKVLIKFNTSGIGTSLESQIVTKGQKMTPPVDPVDPRGEKRFQGWYKNASYTEAFSFTTDTITEGITLYAKFVRPEEQEITGVNVSPKEGLKYNGENRELVNVSGTQDGDKVTYEFLGVTSTESPKARNAGTYTVKVKVERQWHATLEKTVEVTIEKANSTLSIDTSKQEYDYTGSPVRMKGVQVQETGETEGIRYVFYTDDSYTEKTSSFNGATSVGGAPTKAGTYYVKAYFDGNTNYGPSANKTPITIKKGTIVGDVNNQSMTVPVGEEGSYTFDLEGMLPTEYVFGKVQYEIGSDDIDEMDPKHILNGKPTIINEKTISFKVNSSEDVTSEVKIPIIIKSENYNDCNGLFVIKIKDKRPVIIENVTPKDKEYDGTPYTYSDGYQVKDSETSAVLNIPVDIHYEGTTVTGETYNSTTGPILAGNYKIVLTVSGTNKNYRGQTEKEFKIKKKELKITADPVSINVGDDIPVFTVKYYGLIETDSVITKPTYTTDYEKDSQTTGIPKDYVVTWSGATIQNQECYDIQYVNSTLTVKSKRTITFHMNCPDATDPEKRNASEGEKIVLPAPTKLKDGCLFEGWVDSKDPTKRVYQASAEYIMVDRDVDFVAKWQEKVSIQKITAEYTGPKVELGEKLHRSFIKVVIWYSNGESEITTDFLLDKDVIEKEGENAIQVSYHTRFTTHILVVGFVNNIKEITATYTGTAIVNQDIDTANLKVTAIYEDGTEKEVSSGYVVNDYSISLGENRLTIVYKEKTTTFIVVGVAAEGSAVLTFDSQGGSDVSSAVVKVGKTYSPTTLVYKTGYVFKGWYTEKDGKGTHFTSDTIVTKSMTLYAYWGQGSGEVTRIYAAYQGELLAGELKESDFLVVAVYSNGDQGRIGNFTLSNKKLNVGLNRVIITYLEKTTVVTLNVPSTPRKLQVTVKDCDYVSGYVLTKKDITVVATLADGTLKVVDDYTMKETSLSLGENKITIEYQGATTIFIVQAVKSVRILFDSCGGKKVDSKVVVSGKKVGELPTPTRKGYIFEGWYFDTRYIQLCTETNKLSQNTTLYAKWSINRPYKISEKYINVKPMGEESVYITGAKDVQWYSDNWSIASIDKDGIILGIKKGTTTITGITSDGYKLTCTVTVGQEVEKINVGSTAISMKKGSTHQIHATVSPKNAVTKKLTYTTTDSSVAIVLKSGKIVAKRKGTCYIVIQTTDSSHLTKRIKVTVK